MQELLHNEALKLRSMLAVSTMVYNHCQKQGCSSRAVDDIMQSLEGIIGYRCSVNDGNIKAVSYKFSYLEPREGRGGWGKREECVSDREMDLWRGEGRLGQDREVCVRPGKLSLSFTGVKMT